MKNCVSLLLALCLFSCTEKRPAGAVLAEKYCSSCHLNPSPQLLDKETWLTHVLPAMAPKLGVGVWSGDQYYVTNKAVITINEWQQLQDYYKTLAPDTLALDERPIQEDSTLFGIITPASYDTTHVAATTMVAVDPYSGAIYSSGEWEGLVRWNQAKGAPYTAATAQLLLSPATDMYWTGPDTAILTCIGNMRAVDVPAGSILQVTHQGAEAKTLALGLPRPVQTIPADFNKDGRMDYLVCGFGHNNGGLYILTQQPDSDLVKKPVMEVPGAIHAVVDDFDKDGWPDIMALFAYADEGIILFLNDHTGGFKSHTLLRFPPVYGSTGFQLADVNKDGLQDIIYTAGDNGDYSMIMKPYHGLYIYLNKGGFKYEQSFFYPINGCTKAIAADFDRDGDLDIATIAFFADRLHRPEEGFIYFRKENNGSYTVLTQKALVNKGRWICMAAGDYDKDGYTDLVLGNYARGFMIQDSLKTFWNKYQPVLILKNGHPHK